jgi:propanol-preferring alcohol dehydrogenase
MAVQILRALSPTRVIATDIDAAKLALARELGADHTVASGEHAAAEIRELTGGRGAVLVLDCVGSDATLKLDTQIVAKGGAVMAIGVAGGTLEYRFNSLPSDASLSHPYWGSSIELAEVLELARAGHLTAHVEHFPLDRVTDAYDRMRDGTLSGRAVITPHG